MGPPRARYVPVREQRRRLLEAARAAKRPPKAPEMLEAEPKKEKKPIQTIQAPVQTEKEIREASLIQELALKRALKSVRDEPQKMKRLISLWRAPACYQDEQMKDKIRRIRKHFKIDVDGRDIPPPILSFRMMRLPAPIQRWLRANGIRTPLPVQAQGLPVSLARRDMIGVSYTGSGKTLVFAIPAVLHAAAQALALPIGPMEGPFALILSPSRELAVQIHRVVEQLAGCLAGHVAPRAPGPVPALRVSLIIGGLSVQDQLAAFLRRGAHIIVGTPGRVRHLLDLGAKRPSLHLLQCGLLALDEGDRLLEPRFEEDVRAIVNHFHAPRQTLFFSATMPLTAKAFAATALTDPVVVNAGRAGAANLDIIQEFDSCHRDERIRRILHALRKTSPPAIIFSSRPAEVVFVHQYLVIKAVRACALHGGMPQADRMLAIEQFRAGEKDVLVASDVASKGLDFEGVKHVINFDLPEFIGDYVHRIGRTGRKGIRGLATTFITGSEPEATLLDLRRLLEDAGQIVPPPLLRIEAEAAGDLFCQFCQGRGHTITTCPKYLSQRQFDRKRQTIRDDSGVI